MKADQIADYNALKHEYEADETIFREDDETMHRIKCILAHELTPADRTIFILYTELQSFRELGKMLGVSHTTAANEVKRIRKIILEKLCI